MRRELYVIKLVRNNDVPKMYGLNPPAYVGPKGERH